MKTIMLLFIVISLSILNTEGVFAIEPKIVDTANQSIKEKLTVSIAVLVYSDVEQAEKYWKSMGTYLDEILPEYKFHLIVAKEDQLELLIKNHYIDFFISNPVAAIQYKNKYGSSEQLTAWPKLFKDPALAMGSALIVKPGLKLTQWNELSNYKIVSTSDKAFGGYLLFANELMIKKVNFKQILKKIKFVDIPQEYLLQLVIRGDADIAVLPSCVLEHSIAKGALEPNQLKVLFSGTEGHQNICEYSTELYPYYSFSKLGVTDNKLSLKIVRKLLESNRYFLDHNELQIKWVPPVDNSKVYNVLKNLQLWPFITNWQRILTILAPLLGAVSLLLLLAYLYHLRIKKLVKLRTLALQLEIKEHQETQGKLIDQQHQFYKAQRVLLTGEMASGITHELNQPLASIRYLAQGCQYRMTNRIEDALSQDQNSEIITALNKLIAQVDRAENTILRLRTFCYQPTNFEILAFNIVIEETLQLMQDDLKQNKIKVITELEPCYVNGEIALLQQIIVNLVRNSIDAMSHCNEKVLRITLRALTPQIALEKRLVVRDRNMVHLTISDTGIGLTEKQMGRLFFPFETTKSKGLGLGMVICKRIVDEYQGSIWAEHNKPGLLIHIILPNKTV